MKKIVSVVGTRPQLIKASAFSSELGNHSIFKDVLVHTGQHFDHNMSDIFFDEFGLAHPDYNLGIGGGSHGENTGRMIEAIEAILVDEKPNLVVLYGDTDSTLSGAIAAVKLNVNIAHIEAGVRSYNKTMPEEVNRILTDHSSSILFAPSKIACDNLVKEGINTSNIFNFGDVMLDVFLKYQSLSRNLNLLDKFNLKNKEYILLTLHRKENVDDASSLLNIFKAFDSFGKPVIFPIHPRTKKRLLDFKIKVPDIIQITEPLNYSDLYLLQENAFVIATDSGGIQKEAYFHKVPCIVIRNDTEWPELINLGANVLVGTEIRRILLALETNNKKNIEWDSKVYGKGDAAKKIVAFIKDFI